MVGVLFIIRLMVFFIEIRLVLTLDEDEDHLQIDKKALFFSAVVLFLVALLGAEGDTAVEAAAGFFWGSLLAAAYSDSQIQQVYDFFFYVALVSAVMMLALQGVALSECIWDIVFFSLMQGILFRRMYGKADCMWFIGCSVFFAAYGMKIFDFLILMSVSFFLLFVIQLAKKNLNNKGNLKEPVALLPYITAASIICYCFI